MSLSLLITIIFILVPFSDISSPAFGLYYLVYLYTFLKGSIVLTSTVCHLKPTLKIEARVVYLYLNNYFDISDSLIPKVSRKQLCCCCYFNLYLLCLVILCSLYSQSFCLIYCQCKEILIFWQYFSYERMRQSSLCLFLYKLYVY